jgi:hypothetical protein
MQRDGPNGVDSGLAEAARDVRVKGGRGAMPAGLPGLSTECAIAPKKLKLSKKTVFFFKKCAISGSFFRPKPASDCQLEQKMAINCR